MHQIKKLASGQSKNLESASAASSLSVSPTAPLATNPPAGPSGQLASIPVESAMMVASPSVDLFASNGSALSAMSTQSLSSLISGTGSANTAPATPVVSAQSVNSDQPPTLLAADTGMPLLM